MTAYWTLEDGHLVARNEANSLIWKWQADEVIWHPLADLLNQAPALSDQLIAGILPHSIMLQELCDGGGRIKQQG